MTTLTSLQLGRPALADVENTWASGPNPKIEKPIDVEDLRGFVRERLSALWAPR